MIGYLHKLEGCHTKKKLQKSKNVLKTFTHKK